MPWNYKVQKEPKSPPKRLPARSPYLHFVDIPKMTQRILQHYPNTYTFTKSLTEHLILKRVDYNRVEEIQGGKAQWPISIIRATAVGASASEPHPGWVSFAKKQTVVKGYITNTCAL